MFTPIEFKSIGKFVYALSDGIFNSPYFESKDEALAHAKENWPDEKLISISEISECDFDKFLSADAIVQNALELAGDHTSEYEISRFDTLMKKSAMEQLQALLNDWSKNFSFSIYKTGVIENIKID